ncbi:MAG: type III pantothenate kinase [Candidatus Kuenenia sp.]|nr:type III pantothenate kinase [Candidatus Kuenenia hertensis]
MINYMLLAIDIGNTNIHAGVFEEDILCSSFFFNCAEFHLLKENLVKALSGHLVKKQVPAAVVSSVNPKAECFVLDQIKELLLVKPERIGTDIPVPLAVLVDQPEKVGADRLLNALAVYERVHDSTIIIDAGTAITVDVINNHGAFTGGIIAPGMEISSRALQSYTALLPKVSITKPKTILGKNTHEAISSGIYWGTIGMIKQYLELLFLELNDKPVIVATGGDAHILAKEIPGITSVIPALTLEGIKLAYKISREKAKK